MLGRAADPCSSATDLAALTFYFRVEVHFGCRADLGQHAAILPCPMDLQQGDIAVQTGYSLVVQLHLAPIGVLVGEEHSPWP